MATSNVIVSRSGTGFTVNVTACNLLDDLTIKDFFILHNGTPYNVLADYTKTSRTILTYTGAALGTTTIEVRRKTPSNIIRQISFGERMSSNLWNQELDRKTRWQEEADLNGVGVAFSGVVPSPRNDPFGVIWNGDTVFPPSRDVLYDHLITLAPLLSPAFTGTPTATTASPGNNSTRIATTAYVDAADALKANLASPALTGTPTAPTPASSSNNTSIATTAFVKNWATAGNANSFDIGTIRVQYGSNVISTDSFGDYSITYPVAFVSDPAYSILVANGDAGVGQDLIASVFGTSSNVSFAGRVQRGNNTPYASSAFRLNWFAVGRAV